MQRPRIPDRSRDALAPALRDVRAVVFDTDGVITDSARVHAAAWKEAFDAFLRAHPPEDPALRRPFDERDDYLRHVDGKSRLDGAEAFLAARGIETSAETVRAVAADKERLFTQRLREQGVDAYPYGPRVGVDAYPGTVRLVQALRAAGVPRAAASASRHAGELLSRAGVLDLFDALVDGGEAARLGLPGKPEPDLFLEAVRRLGVPADRAAVVEDALAGVEAGRRGGFALVVGVDRAAGADTGARLLLHGADIVVHDLGELCAGGAPK
ncbi:haloacid dehalogenase superfamily, subfamily IA, variant 3 with third motif having DD or ED [Streptomyces sp. cf386]|uniref:HAD family hydrolase n=1 Tax=Streptomyces sp. cf386 TaxID=1761904 RepID=UPI0008847071|nr:HAD-IA family hydrolase [Streptomyces sp. cf386]SDN46570.1 haloacid dehalogenase superfamily, subfamily IA, variant 3 with third motif having DD or ED [Streptomyces sp. cf386]